MAYPSPFNALEKERGKPIGIIIVETLNKTQSMEKAANELGVSTRRLLDKYQECEVIKDPPHWRLPGDSETTTEGKNE